MNDKAELMAIVLTSEAILDQLPSFPNGVEFFVDNRAVCDLCASIAAGGPVSPTVAHCSYYRRFHNVVTTIDVRGFFCFTWVPSHTGSEAVLSGKLTKIQQDLNGFADQQATIAKRTIRPPQSIIDAAKRRIKLTVLVQKLLIEVHCARKEKEAGIIAHRLKTKAIEARCARKVALTPSLLSVQLVRPAYCFHPGVGLYQIHGLGERLRGVSIPFSSRRDGRPLEAIKWYWSQLKWPRTKAPLNRGASWLELYLDFVAATGIRVIGSSHSLRTKLEAGKDAFSSLSRVLWQGISPDPLFPGVVGKGTSLAPFGISNELRGISTAPFFLATHIWVPFVLARTRDAPLPRDELCSSLLSSLPSSSPPLFSPLQDSFLRLFLPTPIGVSPS